MTNDVNVMMLVGFAAGAVLGLFAGYKMAMELSIGRMMDIGEKTGVCPVCANTVETKEES